MNEPRPLDLGGIALTALVGPAVIGATTNAINAVVSPEYFVAVLRWDGVEHVWRAAVAQGVFEGSMFGVALSAVYTTIVGFLTGGRCPCALGARHLLWLFSAVCASWGVGGLLAVAVAALSPEWFHRTLVGVPDTLSGMLAYAWVGGSISGAELGGVVWLPVCLVLLRAGWASRR